MFSSCVSIVLITRDCILKLLIVLPICGLHIFLILSDQCFFLIVRNRNSPLYTVATTSICTASLYLLERYRLSTGYILINYAQYKISYPTAESSCDHYKFHIVKPKCR